MVTLLCSCVKQTEQGIKPEPTASTEMTATSEQMPEYDTLELTQNTIAVEPGDVYYLPLGEGKYIPANDAVWKEYLDGQEFSMLENLSMPFIAVGLGESAHVYVIENPFRTKVIFTCEPDLRLKLVAEESPLDQSTAKLNCEIAAELLQMQGLTVDMAENGQRALEKFRESGYKKYDCILMDIQMPVMDGCQATKAIRSLSRNDAQDILILALTANAFSTDLGKVHNAGMNDHIAKPINVKRLMEVLREWIV